MKSKSRPKPYQAPESDKLAVSSESPPLLLSVSSAVPPRLPPPSFLFLVTTSSRHPGHSSQRSRTCRLL
ncbi:hypothetical protein PBY51_007578 [Eleginops maclovinus]|uniref:Uncharacterized protein n=1 Tax=Eleginops maclovinus TaxID=56733 RepID=A0AAN7X9B2_ELEMC|nr:hypothetical protein PBY51_007578 [Eleginops maclovinus]